MLLPTYKEWLDGFDLITITNKVNGGNDEKKLVFGTFKIQDYVEIHKEVSFCLHSDIKRITSLDKTTQSWNISFRR